jgi:signal peptidase II
MSQILKRSLALFIVLLIADQVSKQWIVNHFVLYEGVPLTSYFNIIRVHNPGAAFSLLADAGGWQKYFFTILGVVVSGYLVWLMWQSPDDKRLCMALTLIVSGALGNVIDRVRHGYVVDFLDVHFAGMHWPAFNVADSCICIGAVLMVWDEIAKMRSSKHDNEHTNKMGR